MKKRYLFYLPGFLVFSGLEIAASAQTGFLDDREIADIRTERYFIVLVEPGKHTFRLKNKKFGGIEMDFEAGKTYYLRINRETDVKLKPSGITRVEPESGAYGIKQLRPVS